MARWFEVVPGRRGGRPTVRGTRVTVDDVLGMLAAGWRPEEVAEELEIPPEAVREALEHAPEAARRPPGPSSINNNNNNRRKGTPHRAHPRGPPRKNAQQACWAR